MLENKNALNDGKSLWKRPIITYALWIVQGLLAVFFLASGGPKLLLPLEALPMPLPLPGPFVLFIGVAEVLGAIGLVFPWLLGIRPGLTPLAAAGLVLITIGATVCQLAVGQGGSALFAVVVGLLSTFVAYGRWRLTPHRGPASSRNADSGNRALPIGSVVDGPR